LAEGAGEVREMIDICDYAVGLSRTIGGLTLPSERPNHVMHENWYPLGPVGVISAFNFPVAVWAWNFALAIVCGNPVIWKPSEKTPVCAIACHQLFERVAAKFSDAPKYLSQIIIADRKVGEKLVSDSRIPLISATGSTRMGKSVGEVVAKRFGRSLLELGGNNAIIVTPSADLNVALPSILFGSVGTAGQRCTTTRRIFAHQFIYEDLCARLKTAYRSTISKIGDPLEKGTLIGPLIDKDSFDNMQKALSAAKKSGAEIIGGKRVLSGKYKNAYYVEPALVKLKKPIDIVNHETFAPILYIMPYKDLDQAIELNNSVPQGLSSAIFTSDLREAELFKKYSDCGIANDVEEWVFN
jgi:aldehyde dehydrogenase (NAD+)